MQKKNGRTLVSEKIIISKVVFKFFTRAIINVILEISNSTPIVIRHSPVFPSFYSCISVQITQDRPFTYD